MKTLKFTNELREKAVSEIIDALKDCYREDSWYGLGIDILWNGKNEISSSDQNNGNIIYQNAYVIGRINQFEVEKDDNNDIIELNDVIDIFNVTDEILEDGLHNLEIDYELIIE